MHARRCTTSTTWRFSPTCAVISRLRHRVNFDGFRQCADAHCLDLSSLDQTRKGVTNMRINLTSTFKIVETQIHCGDCHTVRTHTIASGLTAVEAIEKVERWRETNKHNRYEIQKDEETTDKYAATGCCIGRF